MPSAGGVAGRHGRQEWPNLIVIVFLLAGVLARRPWLRRQPTSFKGAIRVVEGDVEGVSAKWRRGYGRWIRDVLIWEKAPFLLRSEFVLANYLANPDRAAGPGEVKRLGKSVAVVSLAVEGGARIETAAPAGDRERAHGPFLPPERTTGVRRGRDAAGELQVVVRWD